MCTYLWRILSQFPRLPRSGGLRLPRPEYPAREERIFQPAKFPVNVIIEANVQRSGDWSHRESATAQFPWQEEVVDAS